MHGLGSPMSMDVKLGTRTWTLSSSQEKKRKMQQKLKDTTQGDGPTPQNGIGVHMKPSEAVVTHMRMFCGYLLIVMGSGSYRGIL